MYEKASQPLLQRKQMKKHSGDDSKMSPENSTKNPQKASSPPSSSEEDNEEDSVDSKLPLQKSIEKAQDEDEQESASAGEDEKGLMTTKPVVDDTSMIDIDEAESAMQSERRMKRKAFDAQMEDKKSAHDEPKKFFERLWTEKDEIALLKGMIEFQKMGYKPTANLTAFFDFVKKSLHMDATRDQFKYKIQHMKKKYERNSRKVDNCGSCSFLYPHDLKSYKLSKKIWGNKNKGLLGGSMEKSKRLKTSNAECCPESEEEILSLCPYLAESLQPENACGMLVSCLGQHLCKEGLALMGNTKAKELDQRWREVRISKGKTLLNEIKLVRKQTKLILDALSSGSKGGLSEVTD